MKLLFLIAALFLFGTRLEAQTKIPDSRTHKTVKIGNQIWMAENLDVSTYRNGDIIPQVQDPKIWSNLKTGAWCYYDDKSEMGEKYGKLYNWYAVNDPRGLAPEGWHIPSDAEWTKLSEFLGGKIASSSKIKSSRGWAKDGNGTNETGFTALPGGTRSIELFSFAGNYGYWWTSTPYDPFSAWNRFLGYNNSDIGRSTGWKQFGNSVRCVKDEGETNIPKSGQQLKEQKEISSSEDSPEQKTLITKTKMNAITIGGQVWISQNLDVSNFQNGDPIPEAKNESEWKKAGELRQPVWCYYNNDSSNKKKYGKLYNWYAINDKRGLAPRGWHIPDEGEWTKLANELGGEQTAGSKIKYDEAGFNGLFCGFRDRDGKFYNDGFVGYWWSSTESLPTTALCYSITYFSDAFNSDRSGDKQKGFSVRCVKN
jgi:uncharacterized protein (TIGR02145 family)